MNANFSELHSRLNHLVNYSSQLIFVSSESIAEQHRTLEAFIAEQDEQTEVAFITAQQEEQLLSYRRQLCRQLIGQVAGSFVRPLNELLVSLNHHDGPVLIGITQAHNLPNSFLQELWDLVLQSRFASNKQHLNIVLFGDSQWAEEAQSWLPAKNTATPLLLSSESIEGVETELEQLISQKRAAFQQRLANRHPNDYATDNHTAIIKKPWFSLLVILCFSLLFGAILSWQYPEKMSSLMGFGSENAPIADIPLTLEATQDDNHTIVAESSPENSVVVTAVDKEPDIEQPQEPIENEPLAEPQISTSITEKLLVTKWGSSEDPEVSPNPEPSTSEQSVDVSSSIIAGVPALPTLNDSQFLIQLSGLKDVNLARQYLENQSLIDSVWIYKTQRYGGDWFVVVHNEIFSTFNEAQLKINSLPNAENQSAPFVKTSAQINIELKQ